MNIPRLWRTVRHLHLVQFLRKLTTRWPRGGPDLRPSPPVRSAVIPWHLTAWGEREWLDDTRRHILGRLVTVPADNCWQAPSEPLLWQYHLHYHDHLAAELNPTEVTCAQHLLADWCANVPVGSAPAWDPYPLSRRLLNWVVWHRRGHASDTEHITLVAVQARWLRGRLERHVSANHLLVNAIALAAAGSLVGGAEGDSWLAEGMTLVRSECAVQILADGGHYERSAHYHALVLADLLRLHACWACAGLNIDQTVAAVIPRMLTWLSAMTHADDRVALFNDAVLSGAPPLSVLRGWAQALGIIVPTSGGVAHDLADSGYVRVDAGPASLWLDRAPIAPAHQPGHAHADTLTWEFDLDGRRIVVDSGVSEYGNGAERLRQRGTAAHNTVVVDGQNSSEVWSGFRIGRRARIVESGQESPGRWWAAHDGYRFLSGQPVHHRTWEFAPDSLLIVDRLDGQGTHTVDVALLLHPEVTIEAVGTGFQLRCGDRCCTIDGSSSLTWTIESATWNPDFNQVQPTHCLRGTGGLTLPATWSTTLRWSNGVD